MIIRTPPKVTNPKTVNGYIQVSLWNWLRDLTTGLFKLSFNDNFQSFTVKVTIPANTEITIFNQFSSSYPGTIPSGRIITRQQGEALILDGVEAWTVKNVYLRNPSVNDATITVIFFK